MRRGKRADHQSAIATRERAHRRADVARSRAKKAESALAELRREFGELIEQSADVLTRHQDGLYTYVSPASRRVYGLAPEEMIGCSPFDFVYPDDRRAIVDAVQQALRRGEDFQVEHRVLRPDGSCIWVQVAVRWDTAKGIGFGAVRDITERKAKDAKLRESTLRFEAAFEHAPIGMALTDLDGRWIKVNRALSEITATAAMRC